MDLTQISKALPDSAKKKLRAELENLRRELGADIREIYAKAKGGGFDAKIIRMIIRMRKMSPADLAEQEALLDTYKSAIGMA